MGGTPGRVGSRNLCLFKPGEAQIKEFLIFTGQKFPFGGLPRAGRVPTAFGDFRIKAEPFGCRKFQGFSQRGGKKGSFGRKRKKPKKNFQGPEEFFRWVLPPISKNRGHRGSSRGLKELRASVGVPGIPDQIYFPLWIQTKGREKLLPFRAGPEIPVEFKGRVDFGIKRGKWFSLGWFARAGPNTLLPSRIILGRVN